VQTHPTRESVAIAIASLIAVAFGVLLRSPAIVGWAGALLLGLAVGRLATRTSVAGIRAAGFEMLWRGESRHTRLARGEEVEIEAEIRNRDHRAARFTGLRPVCSPELEVDVTPTEGEVPAGGRLRVTLRVRALRVGRHALHGLSLELQGGPGLFEVPLTFANPYGVEVLPRPYHTFARTARGGRSLRQAEQGRPGKLVGEGDQLRELREHQAGDAFRRIAWKASARRGHLMVREFERDERDVVFLLLDASVELWSGELGESPLDQAIDEVAGVALRHLARGDSVGLGILGSRTLAWVKPGRTSQHGALLLGTLAEATACVDSDRSSLDESEVAARVLEHLRPLDPAAAGRVQPTELDRIARRAERLIARAPFPQAEVHAGSKRERALRRYLAAFGLGSPPRLEPDRPRTDTEISRALLKLDERGSRPSLIYLWSPSPDPVTRPHLERLLGRFRRRPELRWVALKDAAGLPPSKDPVSALVNRTLEKRARLAALRGERALSRLGIKSDRVRKRSRDAELRKGGEP
jgi:uncharacterized protein (DUF58 family)